MFSFYLSKDPAQDGRVTFGGYDVASFAKPGSTDKDIFWSGAVRGERYWTLPMSGVGLRDAKSHALLPEIKSKYAVMDTGVSYALIPAGDFLAIQDHLTRDYGVNCTEPASSSLVSTYKCSCKSYKELPDIQMQLDGMTGPSSSGESSLVQTSEFDSGDWEWPHEKSSTPETPSKLFTLTKEQYMEAKGPDGCGTFRLTPSGEKFGARETASYWVMGDIFL